MKPKTLRKKLTLKKETISDLNGSQMKNVYGNGLEDPTAGCTNKLCTVGCPTPVNCPTECSCGPTGRIDCECGSRIGPE